jgi:hypothetical protein
MLPKCNYGLKERQKNMDKKTVKEVLNEACSNGWKAISKTLSNNGVEFDDCDDGIYVDDHEQKKTYNINVTIKECFEYGGDN